VTAWPTSPVCAPNPDLFLVASDPTVSRLSDTPARDADTVLAAVNAARAQVRATAWTLAGDHAPDHDTTADHPLTIDLDAALLDSHPEKENAAPTFKRGYVFHPYARSSTTARRAPVNRWRCCCDQETPGRTPPPTTSP
jgi:hypothetical protein